MKTKNTFQLASFLLIFSLFFSSCEEVIDINLKNAKPVIVIEANVTNTTNHQRVKISQTKSFSEDNSIIPVRGAVISIRENQNSGKTYNFIETAPGEYESDFFIGKPGINYIIKVNVNNKVYTANSTMPQPVNLDSLTITELTFFNNKRKYLQVHYNDPAKIVNQYNYVLTVNGEVRNAFYVESDRFNDGNYVSSTVFNSDPELESGDKIVFDFQCIDALIYRYFFAISQIEGNGGPPTSPANPTSNFDNGALGYFSAHTSQKVSVTIK